MRASADATASGRRRLSVTGETASTPGSKRLETGFAVPRVGDARFGEFEDVTPAEDPSPDA